MESSSLKLQAVEELDGLHPCAAAWDNMVADDDSLSPMSSYAWVSSYLKNRIGSDESWKCLLAFDNKELQGVLPIIISRNKSSLLRLPFRCDIVTMPANHDRVFAFFLQKLGELFPACTELVIDRIPDYSRTISATDNPVTGYKPYLRPSPPGCYLAISGTFDDYIENLSRNTRKNLRRLERKIESASNHEYKFISDSTADPEYLEQFIEVEASGWKKNYGKAIQADNRLLSYYRDLSENLARMGWLEWHFLSIDGKIAAGHLAVKKGSNLYLEKIGYDDNFGEYSPGTKLFEKTVAREYSLGEITKIDCMAQYEWMRPWKMTAHKYYNLHLIRSGLKAKILSWLPLKVKSLLGK